MTALIALIRKDLILYLHDRRALLVNLVMPIVIAAFFGSVFGGSGSKGSAIEVALVLQDQSPLGAKIADGLKADANLHVTVLDLEQAKKEVRKGAQKVAIVVPAGFGDAAGAAFFGHSDKPEISLLYDPSQPAVLGMVKGMLTQQVMQVVSAEMFNGQAGHDFTERSLRQLEQAAQTDPDSAVTRDMLKSVLAFQTRATQGAQDAGKPQKAGLSMPFSTREQQVSASSAMQGYNGYAHSFAGMGVQFILFMGVDMGIGILLARRSGVWNRLLAAPVGMSTVVLGRVASATIIAFGLMCVIFVAAHLIFGVQVPNIAGFVGVAFAFALLTACFGMLIAAFGKTPEAARGISIFATLMMVMLGGAWIPSFLFPHWVQQVALVVPVRWAVDGLDAVTWRGLDLAAVMPAIGVQLAFALVFGALALWKFRREQD
ncbi:ABC transporter permease [Massilia horti]|uniref:ABC transporter permease n=1 Tax=Massilia horti TaxID=2562153 RepID=A0A4Y9SXA8_9BURK|nr:ABC transporter permease [Massilia horti]TFW29969.1 ABC transporter permease [Massilia horti]